MMSDIATYEQAVLATVERRLREVTSSPAWLHPERQVREVRLEGDYPDTKLVVVFDDSHWGRGVTEKFHIHRDFKGPLGEPGDPESIATIVWANVEEFGH